MQKKIFYNGDGSTLKVDIENSEDEIIITFLKSEYSDNNKWRENHVLTDVYVTRCVCKQYLDSKTETKNLCQFIETCIINGFDAASEIAKRSAKVDKITISLPTSAYSHKRGMPTSVRAFKNSFLPLIVDINGEDASRAFQNFDIFGSKAVSVACDALIKGEKPKTDNGLIDFHQIVFLHKKIFASAKPNESGLAN